MLLDLLADFPAHALTIGQEMLGLRAGCQVTADAAAVDSEHLVKPPPEKSAGLSQQSLPPAHGQQRADVGPVDPFAARARLLGEISVPKLKVMTVHALEVPDRIVNLPEAVDVLPRDLFHRS